jgi:glyoxylase-like metal-dependent hydrolase (beta-lactamase superfamily II)
MLRTLIADNASAMTLDGTRTHLVGRRHAVIIDPGPLHAAHLDAIVEAAGGNAQAVLLTHDHIDHSEAADTLAARLGVPVRCGVRGTLLEGDVFTTDAGPIRALATPGHTPDHFAFHWRAAEAIFCGDLMMGGLDTALVGAPEGHLEQYLGSLERLRALAPAVIYPAHGAPFTDVDAAITRYVSHRREREAQVMAALAGDADGAALPGLVECIYGGALDPALREVAATAVLAYLERLERAGLVERGAVRWRVAEE